MWLCAKASRGRKRSHVYQRHANQWEMSISPRNRLEMVKTFAEQAAGDRTVRSVLSLLKLVMHLGARLRMRR